MPEEVQHTLTIDDPREEVAILGHQDRHLRRLRETFDVRISARNGVVRLRGESRRVQQAMHALNEMRHHYQDTRKLISEDVEKCILSARCLETENESTGRRERTHWVPPRTEGQSRYLRAMEKNEVVFCIGPAGTGKTYLAVSMALQMLHTGDVRKIVLARPAVEAGEKLGFLPGDLQEKVNPFLRPLYDALQDMLDYGQFRRYMDRDIIEVVPLAYMRGRTLNRSFVILDEAQNSTHKQMKMFLTRLGEGSKAVITGDVTQIDLPDGEGSGLLEARSIFRDIQGLAFVYLDKEDVVRHRIVQDIVSAYERYEGHPTARGYLAGTRNREAASGAGHPPYPEARPEPSRSGSDDKPLPGSSTVEDS